MKRDDFTIPLAFPGELIIDNFAGGGGTSTGLERAFGRPVDIAINHDPEALRCMRSTTRTRSTCASRFGYQFTEIPDPALLFTKGQQAANSLQLPRIPLTATSQVRMCGNSVSPPVSESLVRANFAHEARMYGVLT